MGTAELIVLGSLNMDIVVTCHAHPAAGETVAGKDVQFLPGGKGLNQAIAAAKWEVETTLVGSIGHDEFGKQLFASAAGNNIDTTHISHFDQPSGTALITVADSGENSIVVVSGANAQTKVPEYLFSNVMQQREYVALGQFETPMAQTELLFTRVRQLGGKTILNPSPFQAIPKSLLAQCDVLIVNQGELARMAVGIRSDDPEAAEWALRIVNPAGRCTVVTLGAKGCLCSYDGDVEYFPGYAVDAIDTTGAGDCFAGVFAAGVAKGFGYSHSAMVANAAAALATRKRGAAPSMPSMGEVYDFLHKDEG